MGTSGSYATSRKNIDGALTVPFPLHPATVGAQADTATLGGGSFSRSVPLDQARWFSVFGVHGDAAPTAFATALANVSALGVTFGGGCYYGHRVYTTDGAATFALTRYEVR